MLASFQMLPEQPADELLDSIRIADELGFRLGPCVAPIYMRDPTYVAQMAATLDELSDGRAEVVFGIGNIAMLQQYGVKWNAQINEAFAAGDVKRALAATPDAIADRLVIAGTPEDWLQWLPETYSAAGLDHALVSFTDPFTLHSWAGVEVEGLPKLPELHASRRSARILK